MSDRTFIIGDIHGMLPELRALLAVLGLTRADHLVLVGDLVDKGPDSAGVVRHLRELREAGFQITLAKGNHEDKHERFRRAVARAGDKVQMKGIEELREITAALSAEDVNFLESAVLFHRLPEHQALVVHAGVMPSTKKLPDLTQTGKSDLGGLERMMRVRYVTGKAKATVTVEFQLEGLDDVDIDAIERDGRFGEYASCQKIIKRKVHPAGSFIGLGNETPDDPFWADVYDGRFGHVFFGHSPFPEATEPVQFPHATALDLGAVFGGRLAAAVLVAGAPVEYISVPARGKFSKTLWEEE